MINRSTWTTIQRKVWNFLFRAGIYYPPVDDRQLMAICRLQGLTVMTSSALGTLFGCISMTNHGVVIRVNSTLNSEERRFTIAHEIGHTIIDRDIPARLRLPIRLDPPLDLGDREREELCDRIASELLLSQSAVLARIGSCGSVQPDWGVEFGVPPDAVGLSLGPSRSVQLRLTPSLQGASTGMTETASFGGAKAMPTHALTHGLASEERAEHVRLLNEYVQAVEGHKQVMWVAWNHVSGHAPEETVERAWLADARIESTRRHLETFRCEHGIP